MDRSRPRRRGAIAAVAGMVALIEAMTAGVLPPAVGPKPAAAATATGYWLVSSDGGMFAFGDAAFYGSTGDRKLNSPIVGMAGTPSGKGYWLVASDGGIFAFGDAAFYGSAGNQKLNKPIVGMTPTASGKGYWLVASDGGIFAFGDAVFHGSTGAQKLNKPIVGMATAAGGKGYWLVASDGGIFAFGDAAFKGSAGDKGLNQPIVGMEATATGRGYWMTATDGGMFAFGDAVFYGSTGDRKLNSPIVGMATTATGKGYWLVASDGGIFAFGDAAFKGSTGESKLNRPIVGMAAVGSITRPPIGSIGAVPNPRGDSAATGEDVPTTISVLTNDTGLEDGVASVEIETFAERGLTTVNTDRTITYTPGLDYFGTDSFTYRVTDNDGDSATGTVVVSVSSADDQPVAVADTMNGPEDTTFALDVTSNDTGLGDGIASLAVTANPAHGTAAASYWGGIDYTPDAGYNGADTFTYQITDADGETASASVALTVNPVNDVPVAVNDAYTTAASTQRAVAAAAGTLLNDRDADTGATLQAMTVTSPAHGTLATPFMDGSFVYTPVSGYTGLDTFTYRVTDGIATSNTATVRIVVGATDESPTAVADSATTAEDTAAIIDVAGNDTGLGDGVASVAVTTGGGTHGTVAVAPDHKLVYTPDADYNGTATFTYKVTDGNGDTSGNGTVTVTVTAVNDLPQALNDAYTALEDTPKTVTAVAGALHNDSDPDAGATLTASVVGGPSHGTVALAGDGSFVYTPTPDFFGTDVFTYEVSDGAASSLFANIRINVDPADDQPVAVADTATLAITATGLSATVAVLANDTGLGDGSLRILPGTTVAIHGTAVVNDDNTVTYTSSDGLPDTFGYTVRDIDGDASTEALVTVAVTPAP